MLFRGIHLLYFSRSFKKMSSLFKLERWRRTERMRKLRALESNWHKCLIAPAGKELYLWFMGRFAPHIRAAEMELCSREDLFFLISAWAPYYFSLYFFNYNCTPCCCWCSASFQIALPRINISCTGRLYTLCTRIFFTLYPVTCVISFNLKT